MAAHVQNDLQRPESGEHVARLIVASALLVCGISIVAVKLVLALKMQTQIVWSRHDLIIICALLGGGVTVVFTSTVLSVLRVLWPWGVKNGRSTIAPD